MKERHVLLHESRIELAYLRRLQQRMAYGQLLVFTPVVLRHDHLFDKTLDQFAVSSASQNFEHLGALPRQVSCMPPGDVRMGPGCPAIDNENCQGCNLSARFATFMTL